MVTIQATFTRELDKESENLIYLLSAGSRRPVADLARDLRLSRRQVELRMRKLLKGQLLQHYAVVNAGLGLRATILLRLRKVDAPLLASLQKLPAVKFVRETLGVYDLHMVCFVPSREGMDSVVQEVGRLCHGRILRFDVLLHSWASPLGYKAFCHNAELLNQFQLKMPHERAIPQSELRVLELIRKEPLLSYRALAVQSGMGYRSLRTALRALEESGVLRFSIVMNYPLLGLQYDYMLCQVDPNRREEFERYALTHPRVHWLKRGQGRWEYVLSIVSRNNSEFIDTTRQIPPQR